MSSALVAQGIEHGSPKAGVAGSNPAGGTSVFAGQKMFLGNADGRWRSGGYLIFRRRNATRVAGMNARVVHPSRGARSAGSNPAGGTSVFAGQRRIVVERG